MGMGMACMAEGQTNYKMGLVVGVMGEEDPGGNCGVSDCFLNFQWMKSHLDSPNYELLNSSTVFWKGMNVSALFIVEQKCRRLSSELLSEYITLDPLFQSSS